MVKLTEEFPMIHLCIVSQYEPSCLVSLFLQPILLYISSLKSRREEINIHVYIPHLLSTLDITVVFEILLFIEEQKPIRI